MTSRLILATAFVAASLIPAFAGTVEATIPTIDAALAAGGPVLVEVAAPWCNECQIEKPIIDGLLSKSDFKAMTRINVDYDSQRNVLRHLQVQSESTLVVYRGGKEVDRLIGATDPAIIEALLRKAL